ncbi:MAG TPA: alpha/beta hydrolase [Actinomycetota bacterium]|nr:alpha/beta hydrolase [Actinomycetota bacterium]
MSSADPRRDATASLVVVHGAGSGPWVFEGWAHDSIEIVAVDLQRGLDPATASMEDYRRAVVDACAAARRPVALCGWSMGGLVAMTAARDADVAALVVLEPSAPSEVQGTHDVADVTGTFDPEETYGAFPSGVAARPESARARADRKRGISVPRLPRRSLVVYGDEFADDRGRAVARCYGIEEAHFPGLGHWDLVLDPRVRARVFEFVA